jgi:TPR repeat protein
MSPDQMYARALELARRGRRKYASQVVPLLDQAAANGHSMAAHALASWYIHGIGVRKDYALAAALERQAARAGIAEAVFNLGSEQIAAHEQGGATGRDDVFGIGAGVEVH